MLGMGYAMMGTASAQGENAAVIAAEKAISCALMEAGGVRGARGVLINITGSSRLGLHEVNEACTLIRHAAANDDVQINFGVVLNEAMGDEVKITVIATGFERDNLPAIERRTVGVSAAPEPIPPTPQMELPRLEPVPMHAESAWIESPVPEEPAEEDPLLANPPTSREPIFDDLDVPAILRRDRRMLQ
jgi:cell division protein FtsZ